jgi:hypothetical protein
MARRRGRPTQELLLTYVLERFLFRLSRSAYRDRLVLKGRMLLAVLGSRRPTGDIDLLARAIDNDVAAIADVVRTVLSGFSQAQTKPAITPGFVAKMRTVLAKSRALTKCLASSRSRISIHFIRT